MISHKQTFKFKPKVKQRPRLGRRGRAYTPVATLQFEQAVKENWEGPCFEVPVSLTITLNKDSFVVTVKQHDTLGPSGLRGDIDNYAKAILDGLNGVAYVDDRLVQKLQVTKR